MPKKELREKPDDIEQKYYKVIAKKVGGEVRYYKVAATRDEAEAFGIRNLGKAIVPDIEQAMINRVKVNVLQAAEALNPFERVRDVRLTTSTVSTKYKDPYSFDFKIRLGNAYTFDPVIQNGILIRMQYVIGNGFSTRMVPRRDIRNLKQDEVQSILDGVVLPADQQFIQDVVFTLEDETVCDIKTNSERLFIQALVGGRSALLKEYLTDGNPFRSIIEDRPFPGIESLKEKTNGIGLPGALIPLNYAKLGQVFVHPETQEIELIRYNDKMKKSEQDKSDAKPYVDFNIKDLIYATYGDYNIPPNKETPDTLNYGASAIPPILALSESNRRLNEVVFPQINESMWSGAGIIGVKESAAFEDMGQLVNKIESGRYLAYMTSELDFTKMDLDPKINELIEERFKNVMLMLMQVRVPSPFMNQENVTNRATIEDVGWIWQQTTLEGDRDWFRRIIQRYWLQPIMQACLEKPSIDVIKAKILREFKAVVFDSPKTKAELSQILIGIGVIDNIEAREINGLPPLKVEMIGSDTNIKETVAQQDEINTKRIEESNNNIDGETTREDINEVDQILSK